MEILTDKNSPLDCMECGEKKDKVIALGEHEAQFRICYECLGKAQWLYRLDEIKE